MLSWRGAFGSQGEPESQGDCSSGGLGRRMALLKIGRFSAGQDMLTTSLLLPYNVVAEYEAEEDARILDSEMTRSIKRRRALYETRTKLETR
ncbi:hypothetical protein Tco_1437629 [Tanacetum coccineum]